MDTIAIVAYYSSIFLVIALSMIGNGLGSGIVGKGALEAINMQPQAKNHIIRLSVIGLALIESTAILALIVILFTFRLGIQSTWAAVATLSIVPAIGIPALIVSYCSALPIKNACLSVARQPFFSQSIINLMLVSQVMIQTAGIFGFLLSLIILFQSATITTAQEAIALCMAGTTIGLSAIGPVVGMGAFAQSLCATIGKYKNAYNKLLSYTFVSGALIETPLIFGFIISLSIILTLSNNDPLLAVKSVCTAICMSIGTFATARAMSAIAQANTEQIALKPEQYPVLSQASMFAQGIIDASAIYALLICLVILFMR